MLQAWISEVYARNETPNAIFAHKIFYTIYFIHNDNHCVAESVAYLHFCSVDVLVAKLSVIGC